MAAIDKLYIQSKEYLRYREWWIDNYSLMIKELGHPIFMYPFSALVGYDLNPYDITPSYLKNHSEDIESTKLRNDTTLWNTSRTEDLWLVKHCNIQSFRDRLLQSYPRNWKGFRNQKWIPKKNKKLKYINRYDRTK